MRLGEGADGWGAYAQRGSVVRLATSVDARSGSAWAEFLSGRAGRCC